MPRFRYVRPETLEEALFCMQEQAHRNLLLAGGTDLMVSLRSAAQTNQRLVDISRLVELKTIHSDGGRVTIGSGATFRDILASHLVRQRVPFLAEACSLIGSPQVRNSATMGGNVVNAAVCADSLPVLICLEANAFLVSQHSTRCIPVIDFVLGNHKTQIQPDEILSHFTFEQPPENSRTTFIKLGRRAAQSVSRATVAVMGRIDKSGGVNLVRIVLGAVSNHTERSSIAEEYLLGKQPTAQNIEACGQLAAEQIIARNGRRWSTEYKEPVCAGLAQRALGQVFPTSIQVNSEDIL